MIYAAGRALTSTISFLALAVATHALAQQKDSIPLPKEVDPLQISWLHCSPSPADATCAETRDRNFKIIEAEINGRAKPQTPEIEVDASHISMPVQKEVDPLEVAFHASDGNFGFETASSEESAAAITKPCDIEFDMPFPIERAVRFYQTSEDAKKCSRATRNIRSLVADVGADAYKALQSAAYINNSEHNLSRSLVEDYVSACTKPFVAAPNLKLLSPENVLKIRKTVGLIKTPNTMCIGAFVGNVVMTAKHCFETSQVDGNLTIEVSASTDFTTIDGTDYALKPVVPGKTTLLASDRDKDWILLKTVDGRKPEGGGLPFKPALAQRWQPILLLGLSRYNMALANKYEPDQSLATLDISPICAVMARDGAYLYHACQTLEGMSGTPLLSIDNGHLVSIGIHTGDAEKVPTGCGKKLSQRYPNYGIVPNVELEDLK
jgi:hypothetical protein